MSSTQTQLSRSTRVGRRTRGRNHSYSPPNLRLLPPPRQPPGERSSSQGAPRPTGAQRAITPAPHRPALQLTAKYPSPRTVTSERQGLAVRKYAVAALPASDFATAILGGLDTESKGWGAVPSRPVPTQGNPGQPVSQDRKHRGKVWANEHAGVFFTQPVLFPRVQARGSRGCACATSPPAGVGLERNGALARLAGLATPLTE